MSLMLDNGELRSDLRLPEDKVGDKIQKDFDKGNDVLICLLVAGQQACVVGSKLDNSKVDTTAGGA